MIVILKAFLIYFLLFIMSSSILFLLSNILHNCSDLDAIINACDYAVVGLGVSSTVSWYICSKKRTYEENHVRMIMEGQGLRHISKAKKENKDEVEGNLSTKN